MIFLLSVLEGLGHVRAAQAVHKKMKELGLPAEHVEDAVQLLGFPHGSVYRFHVNLLQWLPRRVSRGTRFHKFLADVRQHWTLEELKGPMRMLAAAYTEISHRPMQRRLNEAAPHAIVSFHPLSNQVTARLLTEQQVRSKPKLTVVTTELVTRSQFNPAVDLYFAATERSALAMTKKSQIPREKIVVSGLPVHSPIYSDRQREDTRLELGFESSRPTIYVAGGGFGRGEVADWLRSLQRDDKLQIIVVCGGNKTLQRELAGPEFSRQNTRVFGYVADPTRFMSVSNIYCGLEGGATAMQMINYGVVSIFPMPTKHDNAQFLRNNAGGMILNDHKELPGAVDTVMGSLEARRGLLAKFARPDAAETISRSVAGLAGLEGMLKLA